MAPTVLHVNTTVSDAHRLSDDQDSEALEAALCEMSAPCSEYLFCMRRPVVENVSRQILVIPVRFLTITDSVVERLMEEVLV